MKTDYNKISKNIVQEFKSTKSIFQRKYICRAPFTSLRFDFNGNVYTCCYNKIHLLGSYPEQTISNIWNGLNRKKLEVAILHNDLSHGCELCKSQLENKEYFSVKSRLYDHLKINKDFPSLLEFELDNTCNLECIMCNGQASSSIRINREGKELRKSIYDGSFLDQIESFLKHITHANFIGGEPFLIPLYYDIWEKIISINKKARINVSSNGTILNPRIKDILARGRFDISVSVDSIKKDTYEKIRTHANFEQTFQNIDFFNNYCIQKNTGFNVWICPMVINAYEIPEMIQYFTKKNITVYFNTVTMPHHVSIQFLDYQEIQNILNHYNKQKYFSNHSNLFRFKDLIKQIQHWGIIAKNREKNEQKNEQLSSEDLKQTFLSDANQLFKSLENSEELRTKFTIKLDTILQTKNELTSIKLLRFILSMPIAESTNIILTNNIETIEEYIKQNF